MNEEAQGVLLYLVPIVLRVNVHIVNVDSSALVPLKRQKNDDAPANITTFHVE
jgi:hypothetical protein